MTMLSEYASFGRPLPLRPLEVIVDVGRRDLLFNDRSLGERRDSLDRFYVEIGQV